MTTEPLTDQQIEHWRKALLLIIGPYAMWATREEIQAFRDRMQTKLDEEVKP